MSSVSGVLGFLAFCLGCAGLVFTFMVTTTPETNVTTIHKQDRLQLPCPQEQAN